MIFIPKDARRVRPITLLNTVGKLFEKVVAMILNMTIKLEESVHGYIPGKSTDSALQELDKIEKIARNKGRKTAFIATDLSNAFCNLTHEAIIEAIERKTGEKDPKKT